MDIEVDDILRKVALDGSMDFSSWPTMLPIVVSRIEQIAHNEFPIPNIPPPTRPMRPPSPRFLAPLPSSDAIEAPDSSDTAVSSQETNKENAIPSNTSPSTTNATQGTSPGPSTGPGGASQPEQQQQEEEQPSEDQENTQPRDHPLLNREPPPLPTLAPGELPAQILLLLEEITATVTASFSQYPPHTIQRLAELVLNPKQHYRSLTGFLHALDRIVHVSSGANIYPLPPAVPDMSAMSVLANGIGVGPGSSRLSINSSTAAATIGSDEALGGALLTPIPWLMGGARANGSDDDGSDLGGSSPLSASGSGSVPAPGAGQVQIQPRPAGRQLEAQLRTESTETIDGPNGMGSIETVTISLNGMPSTGMSSLLLAQVGSVTQGELLRQEQRAGVVPVSQLSRHLVSGSGDGQSPSGESSESAMAETGSSEATIGEEEEDTVMDDDELPHAGPEEISAADLGPQSESTSSFVLNAEGTLDMQGIDVEAAVGRRAVHSPNEQRMPSKSPPPNAPPRSPKREADSELDGLANKRVKEDTPESEQTLNQKSADPSGGGDGEKVPEKDDTPKDSEGDVILTDSESTLDDTKESVLVASADQPETPVEGGGGKGADKEETAANPGEDVTKKGEEAGDGVATTKEGESA